MRKSLQRFRACVAVAFVAWSSAACPRQSLASACSGDCDGDLQVSAAELVAAIRVVLGANPPATCRSLDANGDGQVAIDDLVRAVTQAVHGCGGAIAEAALGVELSLIDSVDAWRLIDFGFFVGRPRHEAAGQRVCAFRGFFEVDCTVSDGVSTFTAEYVACHNYDPRTDYNLIREGELTLVVDDPGACTAATLPPPGASYRYAATFTDLITDPLNRLVAGLAQSDIRVEYTAQPSDCPEPAGTVALQGGLTVFDRRIPIDATFDYGDLNLTVSSPAPRCERVSDVHGAVTIVDHPRRSRFAVSTNALTLVETSLDNGARSVAVNGDVDSECLGGHVAIRGDALRFETDSVCPVGGSEEMSIGAEPDVRVNATATGGWEFDYDGDGSVDRVVTECRAPSLARCVGE